MLRRAVGLLILCLLAGTASAQTTTPGSRALPPVPNVSVLLRNVPGAHSSTTFLNGLGQLAVPAGSGNVSGPGSSTNGFIPTWSGTGGTSLATGLAVGNSGANKVMQADSGGKVDRSVIPMPLNVTDTGHFEYSGTTPSPNANCGTGAAVSGNDVVGRIALGTGISGTFCQITFGTTWINTPICNVWDETNGQALYPQPSTTVLAIVSVTGNLTSSHSVSYNCVGYR